MNKKIILIVVIILLLITATALYFVFSKHQNKSGVLSILEKQGFKTGTPENPFSGHNDPTSQFYQMIDLENLHASKELLTGIYVRKKFALLPNEKLNNETKKKLVWSAASEYLHIAGISDFNAKIEQKGNMVIARRKELKFDNSGHVLKDHLVLVVVHEDYLEVLDFGISPVFFDTAKNEILKPIIDAYYVEY